MTRTSVSDEWSNSVPQARKARHRARRTAGVATTLGIFAGLLAMPTPASAGPPAFNGKIAFAATRDGNYEIYAMDPDGGNPTNLTNHPAVDYEPAWSPDGKRIAFVSNRTGRDSIFVMKADGTNPTLVTPSGTSPTWSPDGKRIAFQRSVDHVGEIFVVGVDGTGLTNVTNTVSFNEAHPAWSPDGTRIAYWKSDGYIWTSSPDGSNPTKLSTLYGGSPTWSPDGKKIAFSGGDGDSDIYIMGSDGSNPTSLPLPGDDVHPAWSPDGKKITFEHRPEDGTFNSEIFVINVDGSDPKNLTNHPFPDVTPSWQKALGLPLAANPATPPGPPSSAPPPWAAQPPRR